MTTLSGRWVWGPASASISARSSLNSGSLFNLNDADNAVRVRFVVPKDGTLSKIGIRIDDIVGTPPAYSVSFKDGGGNLYGGCAAEDYTFSTDGYHWVTLATPATAQAGDLVLATLEPGGTAPDGGNYIQVVYYMSALNTVLPVTQRYTTSWLSSTGSDFGVLYSDDSVALPGILSGLPLGIRTSSTPDEGGALLRVPFACQCRGALTANYPANASADFEVRLYNAAGTVLASATHDGTYHGSGAGFYTYEWDAVTLAADTDYRLAILPTTTNYTYLNMQYHDAAASRAWWPEGARWQLSTRTDAGSWTEDDTAMPMLALILSEITLPEGGSEAAPRGYGLMVG